MTAYKKDRNALAKELFIILLKANLDSHKFGVIDDHALIKSSFNAADAFMLEQAHRS